MWSAKPEKHIECSPRRAEHSGMAPIHVRMFASPYGSETIRVMMRCVEERTKRVGKPKRTSQWSMFNWPRSGGVCIDEFDWLKLRTTKLLSA
ncbi:hypothetical protein CONPUDRAFT_83739 [Coniophora puteana RWD-64-598 SS2]|uniref:Uncharacterized protein n=1 Tax=Coniophora puteana (strain RWD-64-598) TaxID=741705 RepID=A0A5M3MHZ4_CONPW|nr:uncharacterized protein CONPUDRAFT_83739 [Coniophora puteana RWD-64-598 SS2]EIW78251.1 hypothetical protein CONPUDRAFT_83739 [Coniophora puteana RWD-64-598 SS2]